MDLIFTGLSVLVLLLMSGFFSLADTALTRASRPKILSMCHDGEQRAAAVQQLFSKQERLLSTLLFGKVLANVFASALMVALTLQLFGAWGILIATLAMVVLIIVITEILPRAYVLGQADSISLHIAPYVLIVYYLLLPLTMIILWIGRKVGTLFGTDLSRVQGAIHHEVLRGAIDMHTGDNEKENVMAKHERAMLRSVLDLADVTVAKVMTYRKHLEILDASMPVSELLEKVLNSPYSRIPLYQDTNDNIVGILQTRLLVKQLRASNGDDTGIDFFAAVSEPWFIPETTSLFDQLHTFRDRKEQLALVVDEYGALLGLVTREDILEEIVGNIDNTGVLASISSTGGSQSYVVDGAKTIRELIREFEWNLPDEEYATVAGLIIYETQRLPQVGQSFQFYGFRFEILDRQRNQITSVRITPPETIDRKRT